MEQIQQQSSQQNSQILPHLVQVYQSSAAKLQNSQIIHFSHPSLQNSTNAIYQHTITSDHMGVPSISLPDVQVHPQQYTSARQHLPVATTQEIQMTTSEAQTLSDPLQPQLIHGQDVNQAIQMAHHFILPQHMILNTAPSVSCYAHTQYDNVFQKQKSPESALKNSESQPIIIAEKTEVECKTEDENQQILFSSALDMSPQKRSRNLIPNPSMWACNVRKLKHQRGEAYISRRGKFVPEKKIINTKDCLKSCKYKCNEYINDMDREHIFRAFYSLSSSEKKYFLLNTTERNLVKHSKILPDDNYKRKYSFKYFFLLRAVRYTVCKNFYLATLAISQKPVYNVHQGKSEMNIPKPDGRGHSEASAHALSEEAKNRVRRHIMSFKTINSKQVKHYSLKRQPLGGCLSVKKMYLMYSNECSKDSVEPVKESMYRNIISREFNVYFKKASGQLCIRCKGALSK